MHVVGTDCQDCGPVGFDNFTMVDDDEFWDDDDDYYSENDEKTVSPCVKGTDCTDCGGVDAVKDYSQPLDDETAETCVNTCSFARDGVCDDPRGTMYCSIGK